MIKVRFAPSPTGHLHIGNAKTALFNYLFARKNEGIFVLRLEDTDIERSEARYERSIMDDLRWLGISWDEGPYRQSERSDMYRSYAKALLEKGLAYKCFCTEEELSAARHAQLAKSEPPRYSGKCAGLSKDAIAQLEDEGRPFTVRFRAGHIPIKFIDGIRGEMAFPRGHVDDFIILRNDSSPTYNLAVVIDDMLMGITHVIRGSDHISNTPKQIALFSAFGSTPPQYAHHSLLIGADHKPLSKRHGATRVIDFQEMGILRESLVNYLGTMGRNIPSGLMDLNELIRTFSLDSVSASDNIFDMEKLLWFNREYIKTMPLGKLLDEAGLDPGCGIWIAAIRENAATVKELKDYLAIFEDAKVNDGALSYLMKTKGAEEMAHAMKGVLTGKTVSFEELVDALDRPADLKKKDVFMILRTFITGRKDGPPLKDIFPLVPRDIITRRIDNYLGRKSDEQ